MTAGAAFTSLLGDDLTVSITDTVGTGTLGTEVIRINDATLIGSVIQATNGLIYVIDRVLQPTGVVTGTIANTPVVTGSVASGLPAVALPLITDLLATDPRFRTLVQALQATGVYTELQSAGPFMLLAPVDDAFAALPSPLADNVFAGTAVWMRILRFHIIPGKRQLAAEIENEQNERTQEGSDILFLRKEGALFANEAEVIAPDLEAANGIIYVIDTVLVPPLD